jgi:hypothetical protein
MSELLPIPQTIALLKTCWETAEARVCREVGTKYRESDEETITVLLCGELRQEFDERNANREFEYAFAVDLRDHFPFSDLNWVSHGLIGRVAHHPTHVEKTTGGDFGLVIGRPQVEHRWETEVSMHSQGLLVQAKKQSKTGKVGKLTKVQRTVLPAKLEYTAFVLYMYAPGGPELAPFAWVCADGRQLPAVEADLAKLNGAHSKTINGFREIMTGSVSSSTDIIEAVSQGARGTSDQRVIDMEICPAQASSVTIEITWRDGKPPEPPAQKIRHQVYVQQRV